MRRRLLLATPLMLGLAACQAPGTATTVEEPASNIFFTADSAALDEAAQAVVANVATRAKAQPDAIVRVLGFAAPDAGSAQYNRTLALARAQAVQDALVEAGIARPRIRVESRGAVQFEMFPTESRRVEVLIGR